MERGALFYLIIVVSLALLVQVSINLSSQEPVLFSPDLDAVSCSYEIYRDPGFAQGVETADFWLPEWDKCNPVNYQGLDPEWFAFEYGTNTYFCKNEANPESLNPIIFTDVGSHKSFESDLNGKVRLVFDSSKEEDGGCFISSGPDQTTNWPHYGVGQWFGDQDTWFWPASAGFPKIGDFTSLDFEADIRLNQLFTINDQCPIVNVVHSFFISFFLYDPSTLSQMWISIPTCRITGDDCGFFDFPSSSADQYGTVAVIFDPGVEYPELQKGQWTSYNIDLVDMANQAFAIHNANTGDNLDPNNYYYIHQTFAWEVRGGFYTDVEIKDLSITAHTSNENLCALHTLPEEGVCDGIDNNGNGLVDEDSIFEGAELYENGKCGIASVSQETGVYLSSKQDNSGDFYGNLVRFNEKGESNWCDVWRVNMLPLTNTTGFDYFFDFNYSATDEDLNEYASLELCILNHLNPTDAAATLEASPWTWKEGDTWIKGHTLEFGYFQEWCDNTDNDFDGYTDEGCDDDKDGYADKDLICLAGQEFGSAQQDSTFAGCAENSYCTIGSETLWHWSEGWVWRVYSCDTNSGDPNDGNPTIIPESSNKIIQIGDSITQCAIHEECWRYWLWKNLTDNGYTNIDFIGSMNGFGFLPSGVPGIDEDHEGHGGWTAEWILNGNPAPQPGTGSGFLFEWLAQEVPDIAIIYAGINDLQFGSAPESVDDHLAGIIDTLRLFNPNVKIIISEITPGGAAADADVTTLNLLIKLLAWQKNTPDSPVISVDLHTGFNAASGFDTGDGIHPNRQGSIKIAEDFYPVVVSLLEGEMISPESADEICDNADNDLDGIWDEGCDDDHDGYADINMLCTSGSNFGSVFLETDFVNCPDNSWCTVDSQTLWHWNDGWVWKTFSCDTNSGDTDDTSASIYPGATFECTSFTYSDWSSCQDGLQTRELLTSSPSGCTGGTPVLTQTCLPDCTESDWSFTLNPTTCPSSGEQERSWELIGSCQDGVQKPASETISCDPEIPTCTSFEYTSWSSCSSSGIQTRELVSSSPTGCAGGTPALEQPCDYIPPCTESDWVATLNPTTCPASGEQEKSWALIGVCDGGVWHPSSETVLCNPEAIECTSFTYSDWSSCSESGTQSRELVSSSPSGCETSPPESELERSCTYVPACTDNNWEFSLDPVSCPDSGEQERSWELIGSCQDGVQKPTTEDVSCDAKFLTCTSFTYSDWSSCLDSGVQVRSVESSSPEGCAGGAPDTVQECEYTAPLIIQPEGPSIDSPSQNQLTENLTVTNPAENLTSSTTSASDNADPLDRNTRITQVPRWVFVLLILLVVVIILIFIVLFFQRPKK